MANPHVLHRHERKFKCPLKRIQCSPKTLLKGFDGEKNPFKVI